MVEHKKSISYKLTRIIVITSLWVLLLTFTFFFLYEFLSYRQITERQLTSISTMLAANSTAGLAFDSHEDTYEILSALRTVPNIMAAGIYDKNGDLFAAFPDSLSTVALPKIPPSDGFTITAIYIEGIVPIQQGGHRLGSLYIKRNLNDLYERLGIYSVIAFVIMAGSFALVLLLSRRLQNRIASPIVALSDTSRMISLNRDYSIRARKQSDDELGILTDAFNNMLAQIQIQNQEIEAARQAAFLHSQELEIKVSERTSEYKKQKDFAEAVVNSSLVLIAVFDTDTRIIGFNKRCEEEFNLKRENIFGKKYADVFPGGINTLTYNSLLRSLNGEIIHNPQYRSAVTGNYYESYMVPLRNENDEVYAVLMTANNISQIVESSEKISKKNIELLQTNEALEQFAFVASHDLQEPLRKIKLFIKMLKDKVSDPVLEKRYMDKVDNSAERMSALINDVLTYSRLSTVEDSFSKVNLNEVLENIKVDFEVLISERKVMIEYHPLPFLYANKLQMHQLFANLINNSIKFCNVEPVIKITCTPLPYETIKDRNLSERLPEGRSYIELLFSDNGIGFEEQYAEKIFSIFQRLHAREKYAGTGIGLALCKKIVQNHHGHISVISAPGKGTTFSTILPLS